MFYHSTTVFNRCPLSLSFVKWSPKIYVCGVTFQNRVLLFHSLPLPLKYLGDVNHKKAPSSKFQMLFRPKIMGTLANDIIGWNWISRGIFSLSSPLLQETLNHSGATKRRSQFCQNYAFPTSRERWDTTYKKMEHEEIPAKLCCICWFRFVWGPAPEMEPASFKVRDCNSWHQIQSSG